MIRYDRTSFFDAVRDDVFGGRLTPGQVSGMEQLLGGWERLQPMGDPRMLAYALGTDRWETAGTMQPIEEIGRGRGRAYGVPAGPWHEVYDGRGLVQLTWERNYRYATKRLRELGAIAADVDLERTPALAMRPDIAVAVMIFGMLEGWFTGARLADDFHGAASDWVGARRVVNGLDHAAAIAAIAQRFHRALLLARIETAPALPAAPVVPAAPAAAAAAAARPGPFARLASRLAGHLAARLATRLDPRPAPLAGHP